MLPALIGAAAALGGSLLSNRANKSSAAASNAMQREFAQNGISWKVADAKKAGIHPLYALGASTSMPSPAVVQDSLGSALSESGQNISRAIQATRNEQDRKAAEINADAIQARAEAREDAKLASQLKNDEVQRQYYASQTARLNQQSNPPLPTVSSVRGKSLVRASGPSVGKVTGPKTGAIQYKPNEVLSRDSADSSAVAGTAPAWQAVEIFPGYPSIYVPSQSYSEQLEGMGEVGGTLFGALPAAGKTISNWGSHYWKKTKENWNKYGPPAARRNRGASGRW